MCICVCGHAWAKFSWGTCTLLALLILNLEQSGKYTPFPRESRRSAAELILCGHSSGTWTFQSLFFFSSTFSSWMIATSNAKKSSVCEWGDWGLREWSMEIDHWDWDWDFVRACPCAHVCVCVLESRPWPDAFYSISPLALCTLERALSLLHWHTLVSSQWKEKGMSTPHLLVCLPTHTEGSQSQFEEDVSLSILNIKCELVLSVNPLRHFSGYSRIHFLYLLLKIKPYSCRVHLQKGF